MSSLQCRAKLQSALQNFATGDLRTSANDRLATLGSGIRTMRRLAGDAGLMLPEFVSDRQKNEFKVMQFFHHLLPEEDYARLKSLAGDTLLGNEAKALIYNPAAEGGRQAPEGGKQSLPPLPLGLAAKLPAKDLKYLRNKHLSAMVQAGELVIQFPESPNHRITDYRLTNCQKNMKTVMIDQIFKPNQPLAPAAYAQAAIKFIVKKPTQPPYR